MLTCAACSYCRQPDVKSMLTWTLCYRCYTNTIIFCLHYVEDAFSSLMAKIQNLLLIL